MDDHVLVGGDAQRGVLVGYAREHHVGAFVRVLQQQAGERGDGARQGPLLLAVGLVPAVEQVPQQLGVSVEELAVEQVGDLADGRSDSGESGSDHGNGLFGEHSDSLIGR
ncbi:hypothetical protein RKD37_008073 [Streptomyces ambofaciens]